MEKQVKILKNAIYFHKTLGSHATGSQLSNLAFYDDVVCTTIQ
jgi:hypothetical protein